jgi:hypothetical protein
MSKGVAKATAQQHGQAVALQLLHLPIDNRSFPFCPAGVQHVKHAVAKPDFNVSGYFSGHFNRYGIGRGIRCAGL